jgi:hypothetical protein
MPKDYSTAAQLLASAAHGVVLLATAKYINSL